MSPTSALSDLVKKECKATPIRNEQKFKFVEEEKEEKKKET